MQTVSVNLPDDLAAFVESAVADGAFDSIDHLFAHALGLVRTETMLGTAGTAGASDPSSEPYTPKSTTPLPPVDLTRQGFDSPAFMADLVGRIKKRADDTKPPKNS